MPCCVCCARFTTAARRLTVALSGLWALVFSLPALRYLKPRPGPPLPKGETFFSISKNSLRSTLATRKQLPQTFL